MKNNNNKIIKKLVQRSLKANRNRNIILVIAIALTAILFMVISSVGMSLINSFNEMKFRQNGYNSHGYYQYLTDQETERIISMPLIKEYGKSKVISIVNDGDFLLKGFEIRYGDEKYAETAYRTPTVGKLPEAFNEIAMETWILDKLSIPHELGQKVKLEYMLGEEKICDDFILSGYWVDDKENATGAGMAFVSKEYADKAAEGFDPEITRVNGVYVGVNQLYVFFDNTKGIDEKGNNILNELGLINDYISFTTNMVHEDMTSVAILIPIFFFALIVMVSGYLLIYNIFYISILRDIRFYGLLKTVGTTGKQLKKLVVRQGLFLSAVGIPAGIILGSVISSFLVPLFVSIMNLNVIRVTINPLVIFFAIVFSLITVFISCLKPAKIASKVSPIEAVRFVAGNKAQDGRSKTIKNKKVKKGNRLLRMSIGNILRNKKKLVLSVTSLVFSFLIFLYIFSYVNSYNMDKFLSRRIAGDFLLAHDIFYSLTNSHNYNSTSRQLTEDLCKEIESVEGVERVNKIYYDESEYYTVEDYLYQTANQLYGLDESYWNRLEDSATQGEFDYEKFATGNYVVIYQTKLTEAEIPQIGDKVQYNSQNEGGISKEFEVMCIIDLSNPYNSLNVLEQVFRGHGYLAYIPSSEFTKHSADYPLMLAVVDSDKPLEAEKGIREIIDKTQGIHMKSKNDFIEEFNDDKNATSIIGYLLCFVIILIGFINYANTNITNIISRKHELAVLESIGMTKKQISRSLLIESILYVVITFVLGIIIGIPIVYLLLSPVSSNPTSIFVFKFSFVPFILYFPALTVIGVIVSKITSSTLKNRTIVEKLREFE